MPTYIVLGSYTDQGIRNIKDTPRRTEAVKDTFWTLGAYDFVSILEAADDETIMAFGMATGALGNVRTQTLRAFSAADIGTIIGKMS
jgi:uncharacterized protein with GYD domain